MQLQPIVQNDSAMALVRRLKLYLLLARSLQLLSSLAIVSMFGFLINIITGRRLGLTARMVSVEFMSIVSCIYIILAISIVHIRRKRRGLPALFTFSVLDALSGGLFIGMITVLSAAGLPSNCGGLTRLNWNSGDAPNNPRPGYTTIRFGPGTQNNKGELDVYCPLAMSSFALAVAAIFLFFSSILLSALIIYTILHLSTPAPADHSKRFSLDEHPSRVASAIAPPPSLPCPVNKPQVGSVENDDPSMNVADGFGQHVPNPPPYTPSDNTGSSMRGHSNERNGERLSGYVKEPQKGSCVAEEV